MKQICNNCVSFHDISKHCENPRSPRWGVVAGRESCPLFSPGRKCDNCNHINALSNGCGNLRSGRWGPVTGMGACLFWEPQRSGDKRGGFLTNLEEDENDS